METFALIFEIATTVRASGETQGTWAAREVCHRLDMESAVLAKINEYEIEQVNARARNGVLNDHHTRARHGVLAEMRELDRNSEIPGLSAEALERFHEYLARAAERAGRRRQPCLAKTRKGHPCRMKSEPGRRRCKFHGGMSTGPKTIEGRERIAAAQRKRWAEWRTAQSA